MKCKKWLILLLAALLLCSGCTAEQETELVATENTKAKEPDGTAFNDILEETQQETVPADNTETDSEMSVPILAETEEPNGAADEVSEIIGEMTLEEKVAQLFVVLPEALLDDVSVVTQAGEMTKEAINNFPVSGFVYMQNNLQSQQQVKDLLRNTQSYSMERIGLPAFLCVDEEGGKVARLSGTGKFDIPEFEGMDVIGQSKDTAKAKEIGQTMGGYLFDFGFNVDFAPVADVLSNPQNEVVKQRSFGSDPGLVSDMALAVTEGLKEKGVYATWKHFPGHGMTAGDTHEGYAYSKKTLEEIKACELIPFENGIRAGISFVMVGHISMPNITGDDTPASLSKTMIEDLLRDDMGFDGIVITDAMNMGAIAGQYSSAEAAVRAIAAGVDLVLMPKDFKEAYAGVIEAVQNGTLSTERINESLERIIKVKCYCSLCD